MNKGKVMVVAGSLYMRIMLTGVLKKLGFNVVGTARKSEEVQDRYRNLKPDIVLVDITSGGDENGSIELVRRIVSDDPSAQVFALVDESSEEDIIVKAVRAGAKGFIRKPLCEAEIEIGISGAFGRS